MNFEKILSSPEASAQILGAIIGGIFTILAGLFSVYLYTRQQRQAQTKDFLEWLTQFSSQYQLNDNTSQIRMQLAGRRKEILAVLLQELEEDSFFKIPKKLASHIPSSDEFIRDAGGIWNFLKNFTDYLYFFEQILAYGEELYDCGMKRKASRIVDHFGWFLRSLLIAWPKFEDESLSPAWRSGNAIFARYLAVNRYQRLCEAAVLLCNCNHQDKVELYAEVRGILLNQTGLVRTLPTLVEVEKKWLNILGHRGEVRH